MSKSVRILAILAALAVFCAAGEGPGRPDIPVFGRAGGLILISQNDHGGVDLGSASSPSAPIARPSAPLGIAAKASPSGEIGAVWARTDGTAFEILYGRTRDGVLTESRVVRTSADPLFSPDLDFDGTSNPWLAWVHDSGRESEIVVEDEARGRTWIVNGAGQSSALTPKILAVDSRTAWVFWTGRDSGHDSIHASAFRNGAWSAPRPIHRDSEYPHLSPSAGLDAEGRPWVVWAAFDGNDYEIFSSRWAGESWAPEERITDNGEGDSDPVIAFVHGAVPVAVWSRTGDTGFFLASSVRSGAAWSGEAAIGPAESGPVRSIGMAVRGDRIGLAWRVGDSLRSRELGLSELDPPPASASVPALTGGASASIAPPFNPARSDDQYTAFGDSITFAEGHGYEPSLESRLVAKFGAALVNNEGLGGETTSEGLVRIVQSIAGHPARYLLLMEGTNDVIFLATSMETSAFNLEEMARRGLRAGMLPLIATIIPRKDWYWTTPPYQARIVELNGRIRKLAGTLGVPLVDQYETFIAYPEAGGGWTSLLLDDGVHPNAKGFSVMSEAWFGGVVRLPFPPVMVRTTRAVNKTLFARRTGNLLLWRNSSKIDPSVVLAFRVYRKDPADPGFPSQSIALVPFQKTAPEFRFFDGTTDLKRKYQYVITTLRMDGVEGACSDVTQDYIL
jgi:lysophospholipase L1-like esterase